MKKNPKNSEQMMIDTLTKELTQIGHMNSKSYHRKRLKDFATAMYAIAEAKTALAFGGCTKCYGKGYATQGIGTSSRRGSEMHTAINTCTCDRGKQILNLLLSTEGKCTVC